MAGRIAGGGDGAQPVARPWSCQAPAAAATTSLTVTKYDAHGTVLGTQTVTYQWMEANLPVQGDGTIHYYAQGPTFDEHQFQYGMEPGGRRQRGHPGLWCVPRAPMSKTCATWWVGPRQADTIKIKAADNFYKWFDYEDVYNPEPRQGKMVVCWYNADFGGYVPAY